MIHNYKHIYFQIICMQARVLVDLILQAGWNYVSVVNTEGKEPEPWLIVSSPTSDPMHT